MIANFSSRNLGLVCTRIPSQARISKKLCIVKNKITKITYYNIKLFLKIMTKFPPPVRIMSLEPPLVCILVITYKRSHKKQ